MPFEYRAQLPASRIHTQTRTEKYGSYIPEVARLLPAAKH